MKDKVSGKVEEVKGRVTGDRSEEMKGKARQAKGDVERKADHAAADLDNLTRPDHDPNVAR